MKTLRDGTVNLRGERVVFQFQGRFLFGIVITRLRGHYWLVAARDLPAEYDRQGRGPRITLPRSAFDICQQARPRARTPIEMMVDRACGLA